ncbi:hypothetical protein P8452_57557 [Trifolium repens]|nr:hypothetical protein QL285_095289 [Trifolium repens]WJX73819.1 hypothetical protein P8452_57557 [Trifolium repens]
MRGFLMCYDWEIVLSSICFGFHSCIISVCYRIARRKAYGSIVISFKMPLEAIFEALMPLESLEILQSP